MAKKVLKNEATGVRRVGTTRKKVIDSVKEILECRSVTVCRAS